MAQVDQLCGQQHGLRLRSHVVETWHLNQRPLSASDKSSVSARNWSIKAVLTIAAEMDYAALEVKDGGSAQDAYAEAIATDCRPERRLALDAALRAYCGRDTEAMIGIIRSVMSHIHITDSQFGGAVRAVAAWDDAELATRRRKLKATEARGYYVALEARRLSLKLVMKAAYQAAGVKWNHLQSRDVFDRFKHLRDGFTLVHEPKARILTRTQLATQEELEREYIERLKRKGQAAFRSALLRLDPVCRLTGCRAVASLEAAHVMPFAARGSDTTGNGMLLRADLHRLFDLGFLAITPKSGRIWLHKSCAEDYSSLLTFKLDSQHKHMWQLALLTRWAEKRK